MEPEQNANELLDRVQAATERYAQWRGAKPGTDPLSIEAIERGLPRAKDELDAAMRELEIARGDYVGLGAAGPLSSGRSVHVSVSRSSAQDAAIIDAINAAGYKPVALPRYRPGVPGVKAEIRKVLGRTGMWSQKTVFDKAWERLAKFGDIAYADPAQGVPQAGG